MIECYRNLEKKNGVVVILDGDLITLTTEFCCIASNLLSKGAPLEILLKAVIEANRYKREWNETD